MKTFRVVLAALAVLALSAISLSNASAQYLRHALIEEGTGTWCGFCPYGAFTIDSMVAAMGENLVAISWHGPAGYNEPLYSKAGDTIAAIDSVSGFPWASPGRTVAMCGAYEYEGQLDWPNPWYTIAQSQAEEAPLVDFRVVNAAYSSGAVNFDVDITPFDLSTMPTEDTAKYYTVSVVTEDGIVESQNYYYPDQQHEITLDNFVHYNVARAVGGKVLGDLFTIKTAKTWPIRRHYHIAINTSDWNVDSLRIKAFATFKGNKSTFETYLDAGQTGYITKLPSTAPPAVWPVLPAANTSISGDSLQIPIVWASGGGVSSAVLDYSIDGGTTWLSIVASTSTSPYEWQLPSNAYGAQVMIRVSDPSNSSVVSVGPSFSIAPKVPAIITITSPMANDSLLVGTTHAITFSVSGPVGESSLKLEYSADTTAGWNTIATISNKTTYNWVIPEAPSATAFVRVTDANSVVGLSGMFAIVDTGAVTNVTIDGAPILPAGTPETIRWNPTGFLGESVNLDYLDPATQNYVIIAHGLSAAITSYNWTNVPTTEQSGYVIRVKYASGATGTSAPFSVSSSGVAPDASYEAMSLSPNPFSASSTLEFSLAAPANVTLVVRDLLGREVSRVAEGTLPVGNHTIAIDGSKLPAGAYEYQLLAGSKSTLGKFSIVR